jgi:peptidoglycan/xylan/chitin deacetylase (PgdA/CDA1 family)
VFETTQPFALFDYFRVPYRCVAGADRDTPDSGIASLCAVADEPALFWNALPFYPPPEAHADWYVLLGIPIFGTVVPDSSLGGRLARLGGTWRPDIPIRSQRDTPVASIWRRADGSVFLPFDPSEIISNYLSERYKLAGPASLARLEALARRSYYRLRPFLPRLSQMRLRRSFSRVQARAEFPRWPVETALHDFYRFLFSFVAEIAPEPVPTLAPWPQGFRWALVLTHDVEGPVGHANLLQLLEVELRRGYRSSWNFVPRNAALIEDVFVDELRASGFEVGVHGLLHDGRDISTLRTLKKRLPRMRRYAERWQAVGFRSPATLRSWELMPLLGFDYDTSYTDTAPFEPQSGGCCSWLPYMINDLVELPMTLPQDHTLFELLGHRDGAVWLEKARFLRDQGAMALILTHPDYIENPGLLASYVDLLDEFREDETAWRPLPREVSAWWRRRAETTLRRVDGSWEIEGPARAKGRIEFVVPATVAL